MKKQWEKRIEIFKFVYSCLILERLQEQYLDAALEEYEFDADALKVIEYIATNLNDIIDLIKPNLSASWTWERLSYTDKAILITAIAEYEAIKTPRLVVIDQALITAKNYAIDDSYKFINPILEKILKNE